MGYWIDFGFTVRTRWPQCVSPAIQQLVSQKPRHHDFGRRVQRHFFSPWRPCNCVHRAFCWPAGRENLRRKARQNTRWTCRAHPPGVWVERPEPGRPPPKNSAKRTAQPTWSDFTALWAGRPAAGRSKPVTTSRTIFDKGWPA